MVIQCDDYIYHHYWVVCKVQSVTNVAGVNLLIAGYLTRGRKTACTVFHRFQDADRWQMLAEGFDSLSVPTG